MHIVIASVFDPIPSDRVSLGRYFFLSKALQERGHQVTCITSDFFHASKSFRSELQEEKNGITYIQIKACGYIKNVGLARLLDHFVLALRANKVFSKLHSNKKIDLVVCASPPLHWANYILKFCKKNQIKSVLDIQDNWPKAFKSTNLLLYRISLNAFPLHLVRKQNQQIADRVVAVTSDYLTTVLPKKKSVFYLGAPVLEIQKAILDDKYQPATKLRFVYMGNCSSHQSLLEFLEKNKHANIEVNYIGTCLDTRIKEHPLINYFGVLSGDALYHSLASNDYGLFINDQEKEIRMPNKLFYYWACGLPVLGISITGEAFDIIQSMGGIVANHEELNILKLQESLLSMDRDKIKLNALQYYDERTIYQDYAMFLENLILS